MASEQIRSVSAPSLCTASKQASVPVDSGVPGAAAAQLDGAPADSTADSRGAMIVVAVRRCMVRQCTPLCRPRYSDGYREHQTGEAET